MDWLDILFIMADLSNLFRGQIIQYHIYYT